MEPQPASELIPRISNAEQIVVRVDDTVELCAEVIGDRDDPAMLLIGGATWSMDWWDDELCLQLADRGRQIVRYDQRDTGQSTSYPPGAPGYTSADLVTDAIAVLDGFGIDRAHVVGLSMGGGVAQHLAIEHRDRVATMTLISTTPIDPTIEDLPGPTPEIQATFTAVAPEPLWDDRQEVIDYIVEAERPYAGPGNFDEERIGTLAGQAFDRAHNMEASVTNHFLLDPGADFDPGLGQLFDVPTLILHGTADPLFPRQHGKALAGSIPGARLIELDDVGHQLPPPRYWDKLIDDLIDHTTEPQPSPSGSERILRTTGTPSLHTPRTAPVSQRTLVKRATCDLALLAPETETERN